MPIIPVDQNRISLDVPGAPTQNIAGAGMPGEALAELGQNLTRVGASLYTTLKEQEARTSAAKAISDDMIESETAYHKIKLQSDGVYVLDQKTGQPKRDEYNEPVPIAKAYREWVDQRFQNQQMSLPSKYAQEIYASEARRHYTGKIAQMDNDVLEGMVKKSNDLTQQMVMDAGNSQVQSPSIQRGYGQIDNVKANILEGVGKVRDKESALVMATKAEQTMSSDIYKGGLAWVTSTKALDKKVAATDAQRWLNSLYAVDGDSHRRKTMGAKPMADMLTPDERAHYISAFSAALKQAKERVLNDFHLRVVNAEALLKTGARFDGTSLIKEAIAHRNDGKTTDFQTQDVIAKMYSASEIGNFMKVSPFASAGEFSKALETGSQNIKAKAEQFLLDPRNKNIAGVEPQQQAISQMAHEFKNVMSAQREDFGKYAVEHDAEANKAFKSTDWTDPNSVARMWPMIDGAITKTHGPGFYQRAFGSDQSYWRPLSKEHSEKLAALISNPKDSASAAGMIFKLRGSENFPKIIDQMVKDKHLSPEYRVVALAPEHLAIQDTLNLMSDKKNYSDLWEKAFAGKLDQNTFLASKPKDMDTFVNDALVRGGMNTETVNEVHAITSLIETKAKKMMLSSPEQYTANPQAAWDASMKSLLSRHVESIPLRNGVMVLPKVLDDKALGQQDVAAIARFSSELTLPDNIKAAGYDIPKNSAGENTTPPEEFVNQLKKTMRPEPANVKINGQSVLELKYWDVTRHQYVNVLKNGQPVYIPIEQAKTEGMKRIANDKGIPDLSIQRGGARW